jgi:hypothetical protein
MQASIKSDPKGLIPGPVSLLCDYIVEHGLEVEGVFRKAGSSRRINELLENICECFLKPDGGGMDAAKAIVGGDEGTNKVIWLGI